MAKRKEIKFQERYGGLLGRRNGMLFMIETEQGLPDACAKSHWVSVAIGREEKGEYVFSTAGYQYFHLDEAKEFCRQIGDGEISLKELRTRYAAEDAAKEQAAIRKVTEQAKKLHASLDAKGLKYTDLLELEVLAHSLGDMGHNILLGYERGEGWPVAAGQIQAKREPETGENPYWAIYQLPEDCRSLFVFASAAQFDKCVKNGVIPLHDDRESPGEARIPYFIGYATTKDLKCLDKLAGVKVKTRIYSGETIQETTINYPDLDRPPPERNSKHNS